MTAWSTSKGRQRLFQTQVAGQERTPFAQTVEQADFCFLGGGLDTAAMVAVVDAELYRQRR